MSSTCTLGSPASLVGLQNKNVAPSATPASSSDPTAEGFRPVERGEEQTSGEVLLIEAYAAIWLVVFAMVYMSIRKQKKLDERIDQLNADLAKARDEGGGD